MKTDSLLFHCKEITPVPTIKALRKLYAFQVKKGSEKYYKYQIYQLPPSKIDTVIVF